MGMNMRGNTVARMWMMRGDGGSLYEAFWGARRCSHELDQLAAHVKPVVGHKQLIAPYQSVEPQAKQGTVIAGRISSLAIRQ
jgi:restriction system protein